MGVSRDGDKVGVLIAALAVLMALGFAGCRWESSLSTFHQDTTNQYYKFQNEVWPFLHCFWCMSEAKHLPYRHGTGKSYSSTEISAGKVNKKTMKKLFFFFFLIEIMWSTVRLNKEKAYIFLKFSDLLDLFAPSWGTTPCLCKTLKRLPDYHYHAQHNREGTPLATLPTTQPRSPAGHQRLTGSE